jgi:ABC-type uncharacterized transport system ATPase subunit
MDLFSMGSVPRLCNEVRIVQAGSAVWYSTVSSVGGVAWSEDASVQSDIDF